MLGEHTCRVPELSASQCRYLTGSAILRCYLPTSACLAEIVRKVAIKVRYVCNLVYADIAAWCCSNQKIELLVDVKTNCPINEMLQAIHNLAHGHSGRDRHFWHTVCAGKYQNCNSAAADLSFLLSLQCLNQATNRVSVRFFSVRTGLESSLRAMVTLD